LFSRYRPAVLHAFLAEAANAFGAGIKAANPAATGTFTWSGLGYVQDTVTYTSSTAKAPPSAAHGLRSPGCCGPSRQPASAGSGASQHCGGAASPRLLRRARRLGTIPLSAASKQSSQPETTCQDGACDGDPAALHRGGTRRGYVVGLGGLCEPCGHGLRTGPNRLPATQVRRDPSHGDSLVHDRRRHEGRRACDPRSSGPAGISDFSR
jgi:hypothetical protein